MARPKKVTEVVINGVPAGSVTIEGVINEVRTLLEARLNEFQAGASRVNEILESINPKPRIGRPPKHASA